MTLIRDFQEADASALWRVYHSAIHGIASADYSPEQIAAWAPEQFDPAKWLNRLQEIKPFVAERRGLVVAYADVQPTGYIDHFFVSPTAARQGVGSLLMQRIHDTARS